MKGVARPHHQQRRIRRLCRLPLNRPASAQDYCARLSELAAESAVALQALAEAKQVIGAASLGFKGRSAQDCFAKVLPLRQLNLR